MAASKKWKVYPDGSRGTSDGYTIQRSAFGGWELRWRGLMLDRCTTVGQAKKLAHRKEQGGMA